MITTLPISTRVSRHSRNLIIVRAGDQSLHPHWIASPQRDFDLFVSYFGHARGRYAADSDFYEERPGPKWPCIAALLSDHAEKVAEYDCVWFPDDDLAVTSDTLNRMFAYFHAYGLCLAQPALTSDSYCTWRTLRQDPHCHLRFSQFVEIMAPIFSREALKVCAGSFSESPSGWGLDWLWPRLCHQAKLNRIAIIDATPVRHTRPCGGELYSRNPQLNPKADAQKLIGKYKLHSERAVAKWSMGSRVQEVAMPAAQRLIYGLRRFNGLRKLRVVT